MTEGWWWSHQTVCRETRAWLEQSKSASCWKMRIQAEPPPVNNSPRKRLPPQHSPRAGLSPSQDSFLPQHHPTRMPRPEGAAPRFDRLGRCGLLLEQTLWQVHHDVVVRDVDFRDQSGNERNLAGRPIGGDHDQPILGGTDDDLMDDAHLATV